MTKEKVQEVIKKHRNLFDTLREHDHSWEHLHWMTYQMEDMLFEEDDMEKVMRWLGFLQGVLWNRGVYTIEQLKEHNRTKK